MVKLTGIKTIGERREVGLVSDVQFLDDENPQTVEVDTLEETHNGNAGDYLMKGIDGELYPIKKDIFERTYDIING